MLKKVKKLYEKFNFSIDKIQDGIYIIGEIEQTKMSAKHHTSPSGRNWLRGNI